MHDDFDPYYDEGFAFDDVDEAPAVLVIEEAPDPIRNLRLGLGGRSWKVKVNWPLVRRLGVTYGPAAATAAATAAGVPLPVAAVVGQVVAETLKTEAKP